MGAYEGRENYIFISYAHKDTEQMLWFVTELQKHCNVWYDDGIHAGNEWADKIADKLAGCSLFLFLVSPHSLSSDNCKDELAMARDSGKPFINIRLSDVFFEGGMQLRYGRYQYFDLFRYNNAAEAVKALFKSESLESIFTKQDVLKKWVDQTKEMMLHTADSSPSLSESNADYLVKFRTADTTITFGRYMNAPIEWEIKMVQKNHAILVSKAIIETMGFNDKSTTYSKSKIRSWLNTEFLEHAFDAEERALLSQNPASSSSTDAVTLLTAEQATLLFKNDQERIKYGTEHAKENGLMSNASGQGWWWLASADADANDCIHRVYSNGRIGFDNDHDNESIGIVPMIVVNIG